MAVHRRCAVGTVLPCPLEESRKRENLPAPRTKRQVRRRIAKDVHGNILAEEITEEIIEEDDWD